MSVKKTKAEVEAIVSNISFMDRQFRVLEKGDGFLLQLQYVEANVETGEPMLQRARKWYISQWATETEIVDTAFAACRRSMDHVMKEHFLYKGLRVYSPHFQIEARLELAKAGRFDRRPDARQKELIDGSRSEHPTVAERALGDPDRVRSCGVGHGEEETGSQAHEVLEVRGREAVEAKEAKTVNLFHNFAPEPISGGPVCPECKKHGIAPQQIYVGPSTQTLVHNPPTWETDHDGVRRLKHRDTNRRTTSYQCHIGHTWIEERI